MWINAAANTPRTEYAVLHVEEQARARVLRVVDMPSARDPSGHPRVHEFTLGPYLMQGGGLAYTESGSLVLRDAKDMDTDREMEHMDYVDLTYQQQHMLKSDGVTWQQLEQLQPGDKVQALYFGTLCAYKMEVIKVHLHEAGKSRGKVSMVELVAPNRGQATGFEVMSAGLGWILSVQEKYAATHGAVLSTKYPKFPPGTELFTTTDEYWDRRQLVEVMHRHNVFTKDIKSALDVHKPGSGKKYSKNAQKVTARFSLGDLHTFCHSHMAKKKTPAAAPRGAPRATPERHGAQLDLYLSGLNVHQLRKV